MPNRLGRLGLIGKTVPPKGLLIRFHRIVRPTLPTFSVAPTTATFFGAKIALREGCDIWRISPLRSPAEALAKFCIAFLYSDDRYDALLVRMKLDATERAS